MLPFHLVNLSSYAIYLYPSISWGSRINIVGKSKTYENTMDKTMKGSQASIRRTSDEAAIQDKMFMTPYFSRKSFFIWTHWILGFLFLFYPIRLTSQFIWRVPSDLADRQFGWRRRNAGEIHPLIRITLSRYLHFRWAYLSMEYSTFPVVSS